jgi:hypothetical protein
LINLRIEIGYLLGVSRVMQHAIPFSFMLTVEWQVLAGAIPLPNMTIRLNYCRVFHASLYLSPTSFTAPTISDTDRNRKTQQQSLRLELEERASWTAST